MYDYIRSMFYTKLSLCEINLSKLLKRRRTTIKKRSDKTEKYEKSSAHIERGNKSVFNQISMIGNIYMY